MGNICRPATVGLDPRSTWKYCGSRDRAEHHHADHHGNDDALREDPVAEDTQRDDGGFAHPMLDVDKPCGAHHTGRVTGDGPPTAPAPFATLFGDDQQRDHAQRQEAGSRPVHPPAGASDLVVVQYAVHHHQGDETDRHVDEEHPTPAGHEQNRLLTGEQATEHGAHHTRGAEDGEEISLVLRPLARGHDVTDDGERQRHQAAGTEPLQRAVPRELIHRGRGGAQQRTDDEDRDGRHEQLLAAVHVRQLAVERGHDGGRDEIRGGHPRLQRIALQVIGNGADGGGDDGLVECGQEHPQHQSAEDRQDLLVRQLSAPGRSGSGGVGQFGCLSAGAQVNASSALSTNRPINRIRVSMSSSGQSDINDLSSSPRR